MSGTARLGVLTGRRRVGKTFLARRLAERHGGLYVAALVEERVPALARFTEALGRHHDVVLGPAPDWSSALEQATSGPLAVPLLVIDELPYLLEHSPELESVIQHAVDDARDRQGSRILLCGSSLAVMGGLLDGARPLRGRADLQQRLEPFDFRTSARFWGVGDVATAFRLHAVLGGSPGYRALAGPAPSQIDEVDDWLAATVLSPSHALFREDSYVLGEDSLVGDRALYASILRALAAGEHRPSRIARRVGRAQTSLSHAFRVLTAAGFMVNEEGVLSGRDPLYRLTDPVVTFLRACVEPWRALLEDGRQTETWAAAQPAWQAQVLGPHLERLARTWTARFATAATLGGAVGVVGRAEVSDPTNRLNREIDMVALAAGHRRGPGAPVLAIGEVKLTADLDALAHLDRCADLLSARGHGRPVRLVVFAETLTAALRSAAAARHEVELVDLHRLYHGE